MKGVVLISKTEEFKEIEKAIEQIYDIAKKFKLDFYDMRFEIVPAEIMYTFGSYGMPTRFSHWSFGKAFHRMKTQYDYNLSRIYELVVNSDPCYTFLLEGNSLIQNKLVIAHVFAHCDFFKNNARFSHTSTQMIDTMTNAAERIMSYEFKYGKDEVEKFLDAVLALQEHIDPFKKRNPEKTEKKEVVVKKQDNPYEDLWSLDEKPKPEVKEKKKNPTKPDKDVLLYIADNAKSLEDWQRDIISIIREEMLYFWPQLETKIMNEGWASYWHLRILREMDLSDKETIDFAKMHAGVIQPSRTHLNPYYLGLKIWEDIEKRWDNPSQEEKEKYGRTGGKGREKMFEIREVEGDISFIRNYLTKELVEELDLYLFKKVDRTWQVSETQWESVRDGIANDLVNCGIPYIVVTDGDYKGNGELYLKHEYEGIELDIKYLERTLPHVYTLWQKPVHLETVINKKNVVFTYEGNKTIRKFI